MDTSRFQPKQLEVYGDLHPAMDMYDDNDDDENVNAMRVAT